MRKDTAAATCSINVIKWDGVQCRTGYNPIGKLTHIAKCHEADLADDSWLLPL